VSDGFRVSLVRGGELAQHVPYAYAAVVEPENVLVFTAGACPLNAAGEVVFPDDVAAQARQVMENLESALRAAGAELRDVAKTTVYVASNRREDLAAAWRVVRERFADHDAPSTLLGVAMLGYRGQLVEVEAVASVRRGLSQQQEPTAG
jgi:enamine deaminase RidA (YjgF/YER057c/UK114 family)